jgi:hypothetical protein
MVKWMRDKLKLNEGDTLKQESHRSKGSMAEMDIYTYSIMNSDGEIIGAVKHTDHTAIRGFRRTQTLEQKDASGNIVVDEAW